MIDLHSSSVEKLMFSDILVLTPTPTHILPYSNAAMDGFNEYETNPTAPLPWMCVLVLLTVCSYWLRNGRCAIYTSYPRNSMKSLSCAVLYSKKHWGNVTVTQKIRKIKNGDTIPERKWRVYSKRSKSLFWASLYSRNIGPWKMIDEHAEFETPLTPTTGIVLTQKQS